MSGSMGNAPTSYPSSPGGGRGAEDSLRFRKLIQLADGNSKTSHDKKRLGSRLGPGGARQWEMQQGSVMVRSQRVTRMPELHASHVATLPVTYSGGYGEEDELDLGPSERSSRTVSARSTELEPLSVTANAGFSAALEARPPSARPTSAVGRQTKRSVLSPDSSRGGSGSGPRPASRLVELEGHTLTLYGPGALDELNHPWGVQAAGAVTDVVFKYIDFDELVRHLPKLRARFPGTQHLLFTGCNIWSLQQLNALAAVRRLSSLTVESDGNPVTQLTLFRPYVLFRLSQFALKRINGEDVLPGDLQQVEKIFGPTVAMTTSLPTYRLFALLGETGLAEFQQAVQRQHTKPKKRNVTASAAGEADGAKKKSEAKASLDQIGKSALTYTPLELLEVRQKDSNRRDLARSVVSEVCHEALWADRKRKQIAALWPQMFQDLVCAVIREMSDKRRYATRCLEELEPTKL